MDENKAFADGGSLDFGLVDAGVGGEQILWLGNNGTAPLNLGALTVAPSPFSVAAGPAKTVLLPSEVTTITLRYAPAGDGPHVAALSLASDDADENPFNLALTGDTNILSLSGTLFYDLNANGSREADEPDAQGESVYLDLNENGSRDGSPAEPQVQAQAGHYVFRNLAPGTYVVRVHAPGWGVTSPVGGGHTATLAAAEQTIDGLDFGLARQQAIYGQLFVDEDADGVWDTGEPGLPGQTVFLDAGNNGIIDRTVYTATDTPLTIADGEVLEAFLTISDHPAPVYDLDVAFDLTFAPVTDLEAQLWHMANNYPVASLFKDPKGDADMRGTVLDDEAALAFADGSAPYTGRFRPINPLREFVGGSPNGEWLFQVWDDYQGPVNPPGTLLSWSLSFSPDYVVASASNGIITFANAPSGTHVVRPIVPPGWRLTTPVAGTHTVTLTDGGIVGNQNFGLAETTPPTAGWAAVSPNPRNSAVAALALTFSEAVTGLDLGDLTLTRNGQAVALTGASLSGSGASYVVNGLTSLTQAGGGYQLSLRGAGSGIQDRAKNSLGTGASVSWTTDAAAPTGEFAAVTSPRNSPVSSVALTFSEAVTGLDLSDLSLLRDGQTVALGGAALQGSGSAYTVTGLASLTGASGSYSLTVRAAGSGIVDLVGNGLAAAVTVGWQMDVNAPQLTFPGTLPPLTTGGSPTYTFALLVNDSSRVELPSLAGAVEVQGPHGYRQVAELVTGVAANSTATSVEYQITAPGGVWDAADNGDYRILLVADKLQDEWGNTAPAAQFGSFQVDIPAEPAQERALYLPLLSRR